jgi:DNA primase
MRKRDLSYVDVEDFLRALEVKNVSKSGQEVDFSCPFPNHLNGDQSPSARMNTKTTLWICHGGSCGLRGDAVDFLMRLRDLSEIEAQRVIDERYGGPELSVEAGGLRREIERRQAGMMVDEVERIPPAEEWLDRFRIEWLDPHLAQAWDDSPFAYMLNRGFERSTLSDWDIGWDEISDRITIPVRNKFGQLVGFKGRAWKPDHHPKYLIIGDAPGRQTRYGFSTYAKSEIVFALDRVQSSRAVICEGELNAIALHENCEYGAVAVAGAEFSGIQAAQIIGSFSSAVVYFDEGDAGRAGTKKVVEALASYMPVSVVLDPPDDAAALGAAALDVIAGAVSTLKMLRQ